MVPVSKMEPEAQLVVGGKQGQWDGERNRRGCREPQVGVQIDPAPADRVVAVGGTERREIPIPFVARAIDKVGEQERFGGDKGQPREHRARKQQADQPGPRVALAGQDGEQDEEDRYDVSEVPRRPILGRIPDDGPEAEDQRQDDSHHSPEAHLVEEERDQRDVQRADEDRCLRLLEANAEQQHERREHQGRGGRVDHVV